jgi:flagellar hook protein FlgE
MRLESALNTGREGITAHGQAIAIVGDNISNSNTVGYKAQSAVFGDILGEIPGDRVADVVSGAGDGVAIRRIQTNYNLGPINSTGRDLDVALTGNGFFQVGDVGNVQYTRDGSFLIDQNGMLTTSAGLPVLGYMGQDSTTLTPIDMKKVAVQIVPTTAGRVNGNLNSAANAATPPTNPLTFRDLNAAASYSNLVSVYDTLGQSHEVLLSYFRTGVNTWTVQAHVNGSEVGRTADQPVQIGQTTLTFDTSGRIAPASIAQATLTTNAAWSNGAGASTVAFDLSSFTQFSGGSIVNNVTQNGTGVGQIVGYEISPQGAILATLTNGARAQVGSLSIATVQNRDGLVRSGSSTYAATQEAGTIESGLAGVGARSKISNKSLEYSNVDLAGQFVELVVLQRAYAANSKVISTASDVIKDTIGLIR